MNDDMLDKKVNGAARKVYAIAKELDDDLNKDLEKPEPHGMVMLMMITAQYIVNENTFDKSRISAVCHAFGQMLRQEVEGCEHEK